MDTMTVTQTNPPLAVQGLSVAYNGKVVLSDVDTIVPEGAMLAIVGPNGAGKSTFLKATLGLVPALSGRIRFFGKSFDDVRRRIAYVPQRASVDWDFPTSAIMPVVATMCSGSAARAGPPAATSSATRPRAGARRLPNQTLKPCLMRPRRQCCLCIATIYVFANDLQVHELRFL